MESEAPLMLSVSGARGIVGQSMTPSVAADIASAFGTEIRGQLAQGTPTVLLGSDGRPSGGELLEAARGALAATGCAVVELGIATTPTVGIMTRALSAHGAIVVTASHNPIEWNGIKCLDSDGLAPPPDNADRIIARFKARDFEFVPENERPESRVDTSSTQTHVDRVLATVDVQAIRDAGFTIVLDSVNASGGPAGRLLLEELGCQVEHLNEEQTGLFAHPPEPIEANLGDLVSHLKQTPDAACAFAQDPDADRVAIVDDTGCYIGEEFTLALAALRVLQVRGGVPLAANLSTSRMIDDIATGYDGASVLRTAVGEANVVQGMRSCDAPLGGEGNGGVIVAAVGWVRDSIASMALVLELMATDGRSLSRIVADLPRYSMVKRKIDLGSIGGRDAIEPALQRLRDHYVDARINDIDGVRIDLEEGWAHLRASNTEPIMRVIAESGSPANAARLADEVAARAGLA